MMTHDDLLLVIGRDVVLIATYVVLIGLCLMLTTAYWCLFNT